MPDLMIWMSSSNRQLIGVRSGFPNASLDEVHAHTELMNANIAELIMGLDDVTSGFSQDFDEMRNKTGMETFIGFFSSAKADSMRQERMRTASIDDKLQDLIGKSDVITQLLQGQLAELNVQKEKVETNLSGTLEERETVVGELEAARAEMVLINKLETDTKQRVVLYDALSKSLKTAQQQDVAHKINEIGVKTDQEAQSAMAAIGAATNNRMADMLEAHEDHMVFAREVLEQKAKADERFVRRFQTIVEKHDSNQYGAG